MAYVITQNCCNDATCVTACPVNCIHPTPDEPGYATAEMLYIDPDTCIDCGACADACPVAAIVPDFELTEYTQRYIEVNAHWYADPAHIDYTPAQYQPRKPRLEVSGAGPLRVAIVGSGPAGCYAAEELLTRKGSDVRVEMFERLPVPWGLARFGVAPDHQATKAVTDQFARTVRRANLGLHLNVEIGTHLTHGELLAHHHAVLYAVGAPDDRRLGLPGEDLRGSHAATDFVAWYNGHQEFADRVFDLSVERAVVVGNGNVALDLARILTADVDELARTDIADHALDALRTSTITEVVVLGRRGPAQAAFTTPELLGLAELDGDGIDLVVDPAEAELDPLTATALGAHEMAALKARILRGIAERSPSGARRRVVLRFGAAPVEILGVDRVTGVRIARTRLTEVDGRVVARPTGETEDMDCGLVLRSVGYRGRPLPGLPFDEVRGTLAHDGGRVVDTGTGTPLTGVYAAGWIKRGPSGVIGTNKRCAEETVQALFDDYAAGRLCAPARNADSLHALIAGRRPEALDLGAWNVVDRHERAEGRRQQRPRVKLTSVADVLRVAQEVRAVAG